MSKGLIGWAPLLLVASLAGKASAELVITEQALSFTEVATGSDRIAYAIIDVPGTAGGAVQAADVRFSPSCPEALGAVTYAAASLWETPPENWEAALDPANGMTGLFFPAEEEGTFHAEVGKLLMGWNGDQSAVLILAFDCREIDCGCSPLIGSGMLRLVCSTPEGP